MNLRHLELFVSVAKAGSFTKAASELGMSQPALSRTIRKLENRYGGGFFERTGRGVTLSRKGEEFDTYAKSVLEEMAKLEQAMKKLDLSGEGEVNVSIPVMTGRFLISPLMRSFNEAFPKARVRIYENINVETFNGLKTGKFDLGLMYAPPAPSGLLYETVAFEKLYIVGHPSLLESYGQEISMQEASKLPLILPAKPAHFRRFIDMSFKAAGYSTRVSYELETVDSLLSFAQEKNGATILPYSNVLQDVESGRLSGKCINNPSITRKLYIVSASLASREIVRKTAKLLKQHVAAVGEETRWFALSAETEAKNLI